MTHPSSQLASRLIPLLLMLSMSALASQAEELVEEQQAAMQAFHESLDYQTGPIALSEPGATLSLTQDFRFLDANDTARLLEQAWGNPPGGEALGALVPADFHPFEDGSWAVIISYEADGYVSDEDAQEIDYDEILAQMQSDAAEASQQRVTQGYEAIEILGWAEPPYYDSLTHKIHWAKEIKFGDSEINTLNYNIRALGRGGVLVLNAVSSMRELGTVSMGMQSILSLVEFDDGSRYADFDPSIDQVAAYGIGALVAGKLAAKAGLLAKFAPLLLIFKKGGVFIVAGIAALGRMFWRNREKHGSPPDTTSS